MRYLILLSVILFSCEKDDFEEVSNNEADSKTVDITGFYKGLEHCDTLFGCRDISGGRGVDVFEGFYVSASSNSLNDTTYYSFNGYEYVSSEGSFVVSSDTIIFTTKTTTTKYVLSYEDM